MELQRSINIHNGSLVKLGQFKTSEGDYLVMIIHHLVMDGVSWRILLEDFVQAYKQLSNSMDISFPEKSDSFMAWSQKLKIYAKSESLLEEIKYWKKIEDMNFQKLNKDYKIEKRKVEDCNELSMDLSIKHTQTLLQKVNKAYNTEINDILLTCLGLSLKKWCGTSKIPNILEGHGRERIINEIDINRTIGWFTSHFPVVLNLEKSNDISYNLKNIKEILRKVPNKGIGYGILKYLTPKQFQKNITFKVYPEIRFNFLGQFNKNSISKDFNFSINNITISEDPQHESIFALDIYGIIIKDRLYLKFNYNKNEYKKETILKLIEITKNILLKIIKHCINKKEPEFTPADFDDKDLSQEELDSINELVNTL